MLLLLDRMLYIFIILITKSKSKFFDFDNPIRIIPNTDNIRSDSLFGHDLKYSKFQNIFLVSALRAIRSPSSILETGAIYMCPTYGDTQCSSKILPDIEKEINETTAVKFLFGMSFAEISKDIILICAPNNNAFDLGYFCSNYNFDSTLNIPETYFPVTRYYANITMKDNYGIQIEPKSLPINENTEFIYSQLYHVLNNGYEPLPFKFNDILVSGFPGSNPTVIKVSNFPGNKFLVNYRDQDNFLIVPYSDSNFLLGAFEVFTFAYSQRQRVNVIIGTVGQQFGFSGSVGKFNSDDCDDVIFTAPFYSIKPDQGVVMIYYCDYATKKYKTEPKIINGEGIAYARFGFSMVNIKDRNFDNIDDIAVLATYWYISNPIIYIYLSTNEGIGQHYYIKVELKTTQTLLENFAYKLISNFDIDNDNINEIAITYPMQNKFEYFMGVKLIALRGNLYLEKSNHDPNYILSIYIRPDIQLLMCQLILTLSFDITHLSVDDLIQKPILNYKISLEGRDNSFFNFNGYPHTLEESVEIIEAENIIIKKSILYWYHPISNLNYIPILVEAYVEKNIKSCNKKCVTSNKISFTKEIIPLELTCDNEDCLPKLSIQISPFDKTLNIGNSNFRDLDIEIIYSGIIKSYYPELIFTYPDFVKLISYVLKDVDEKNILLNKISNINKTNTFTLITHFDFSSCNKITFNVRIELIPSFTEDNLDLIFTVGDAMYQLKSKISKTIKLTLGKYPVILTGISLPGVLSIIKQKDKRNITENDKIKYQLQVYNIQKYFAINEVYLILKLPICFENKKVFNIVGSNLNANIEKKNCSLSSDHKCIDAQCVYYKQTIEANSITKFSITLAVNENTEIMAKKDPRKIQLQFILKYSFNNKEFSNDIFVPTLIKSKQIETPKDLILPISIAVTLSLLLTLITIYLVYRFKLAQKLKSCIISKIQT